VFLKTDISGCIFVGSNLSGVKMEGAVAVKVDFSEADFSFAYVVNSDLRGAKLQKVITRGATFKDVKGIATKK
jgi:uncharacterized protein YjbI with pentapeptide repeats